MIDEDGIDSNLNFSDKQKRNWRKLCKQTRIQYYGYDYKGEKNGV